MDPTLQIAMFALLFGIAAGTTDLKIVRVFYDVMSIACWIGFLVESFRHSRKV